MNKKLHRSVRDVRTMSDRVSEAEKPQRKFIRLAVLELEKVRRAKERDKASRRVGQIDKRLGEIDREQADLLGAVRPAAPGGPAESARRQCATPHCRQQPADFVVTY